MGNAIELSIHTIQASYSTPAQLSAYQQCRGTNGGSGSNNNKHSAATQQEKYVKWTSISINLLSLLPGALACSHSPKQRYSVIFSLGQLETHSLNQKSFFLTLLSTALSGWTSAISQQYVNVCRLSATVTRACIHSGASKAVASYLFIFFWGIASKSGERHEAQEAAGKRVEVVTSAQSCIGPNLAMLSSRGNSKDNNHYCHHFSFSSFACLSLVNHSHTFILTDDITMLLPKHNAKHSKQKWQQAAAIHSIVIVSHYHGTSLKLHGYQQTSRVEW